MAELWMIQPIFPAQFCSP